MGEETTQISLVARQLHKYFNIQTPHKSLAASVFLYGQSIPGKTSHTRLHCPCSDSGEANHNAKAEAPILWPPDAMNRLIRKDPEAGNDS